MEQVLSAQVREEALGRKPETGLEEEEWEALQALGRKVFVYAQSVERK